MDEHGNGEMQGLATSGPVVADCRTDVGDGDGSGASLRRPVSWDRRSSLASSSLSSVTEESSELDYGDWLPQSEVEEIPSRRWLSPPPTPRPSSSEVDWEELLAGDPLDTAYMFLQVLGQDKYSSGKRCRLVLARGLNIQWRDNRSSWRYHGEVAVLSEVCWLDIRAEVSTSGLPPGTAFVCLLVFKLPQGAFGLGRGGETQKAWVSLGGRVTDREVRLQPAEDRTGCGGAGEGRRRGDGWWEVELGEVSLAQAASGKGKLRVGLREVERLSQAKGGLVVRGVEVRPRRFSHRGLVRVRATRVPTASGMRR